MLVASAVSLRPDIRSLCSIGVQQKFPWHRTSDDEHNVLRSTGVLPANGMDKHAACQWSGQGTLNAEAAHPCQWNGHGSLNAEATHRPPVEWTGRALDPH
jgi:hypothetical protein